MGRRRPRDAEGAARTIQLQELIRQELDLLLRVELRDPRLDGVVVTMVELAGERARIWISNEHDGGDVAAAIEALEGAAGYLRTSLAESLGLKRTPELRFRRDPATRRGHWGT
jgi:ribosome-binding factor A